jgi:phage-related minor tail protein
MRAFISKVATASLIAAAAVSLSACGKPTSTTDNTTVTDLNSTESTDTMSDNMTAVDGTMADNGATMANESSNAM